LDCFVTSGTFFVTGTSFAITFSVTFGTAFAASTLLFASSSNFAKASFSFLIFSANSAFS